MPDLGKSRRKLKIVIGAMLAADVIAAGVLFSPLVGSAESRNQQLNQLKIELLKKSRDVAPLRGMDKKIGLAKDQIGDFDQELCHSLSFRPKHVRGSDSVLECRTPSVTLCSQSAYATCP